MTIAKRCWQVKLGRCISIKKGTSKSYGEELDDRYWQRFKVGAEENGIDEDKH